MNQNPYEPAPEFESSSDGRMSSIVLSQAISVLHVLLVLAYLGLVAWSTYAPAGFALDTDKLGLLLFGTALVGFIAVAGLTSLRRDWTIVQKLLYMSSDFVIVGIMAWLAFA